MAQLSTPYRLCQVEIKNEAGTRVRECGKASYRKWTDTRIPQLVGKDVCKPCRHGFEAMLTRKERGY